MLYLVFSACSYKPSSIPQWKIHVEIHLCEILLGEFSMWWMHEPLGWFQYFIFKRGETFNKVSIKFLHQIYFKAFIPLSKDVQKTILVFLVHISPRYKFGYNLRVEHDKCFVKGVLRNMLFEKIREIHWKTSAMKFFFIQVVDLDLQI